MFNTHDVGNGLKLMEHSYVRNNYVLTIMAMLFNNPQKLVWLCDYHEPDENTKASWETINDSSYSEDLSLDQANNKYFIINHDKNCFIDVEKLIQLYKEDENYSEWMIHPIPLLCNSDESALGGGDYHPRDSRRATWCEDLIETSFEPPKKGFVDVTEDCLFFE